MKIDVIIPSRGREQRLFAGIVNLHALQSGQHDVRYTVLCDLDDPQTAATAKRIRDIPVRVLESERRAVNEWENEVIAQSDADAFMPWPDDYVCLAHGWDEAVAFVLGKVPAFSWQEIQDPQNHTTIVLARKWVKAAGRFFTEHFPFWFADTWLKEVYGFVYGQNMPIIEQLQVSHKRSPTQNMHDLEFWFRVFAATRPERIAEAQRIARAFDVPWVERPHIVKMLEEADAMQLSKVPVYEAVFGAGAKPKSDAYRAAKARAEQQFQMLETA